MDFQINIIVVIGNTKLDSVKVIVHLNLGACILGLALELHLLDGLVDNALGISSDVVLSGSARP